MTYTVGDVAVMLNVSSQSLRRWEVDGYIPTPTRRPTGRREYTEEDIEKIKDYLSER
ncbi:MerR family transcriptional regulator [Chloroflexota bacterium]